MGLVEFKKMEEMLIYKVTGQLVWVGPDAFPNFFFHINKGVVGEEISMAIKDFFRKGCLLKEFNTTLIALLLKSLGANRLPEAWHDEGAFKPFCLLRNAPFLSEKLVLGFLSFN